MSSQGVLNKILAFVERAKDKKDKFRQEYSFQDQSFLFAYTSYRIVSFENKSYM